MPPVTKAGGQQFRKDVEFIETKDSDEFELEATGIVMVPDVVDLQHDFAREDTIRGFADQFETFEEAGQASGGIMHAVWPDGWMELQRNEVLDESEEIGGRTVDAGAWVQRWGISSTELASLIDEGILEGYSIGAIQVDWDGPFEQDEVDNVDTSEIPDDEFVWELTDGIIREVSAVDIPAVPDAQILETKADAEKQLAEHIGNREAFIEEAMERGHTEDDAKQLWNVLNEAMETDGAGDPGKASFLERIGKTVVDAVFGTDDADDGLTRVDVLRTFPDDAPIPDDIEEFDECVDWAEDQEDIDDPDSFCGAHWEPEDDAAWSVKEGRTLSTANRDSVMASVDANIDVLRDHGIDDVPKRFTDREDVDFDLTEHSARTWGTHPEDGDPDEDPDEETESSADSSEYATGGDTPDSSTNMSNTDDPMEDAPEWAKTLHDNIEENSERIDDQSERIENVLDAQKEEKTAQIEIDGEVYEVTESEAKSWFENGEEPDTDPMADAPDYVRTLNEKVETVNERIDRINQQTGGSDQVGSRKGNGGGDDDPMDALKEALN